MANETSTEDGENEFFPNAEELEALYLRLETSIPELQWKNPGRDLEEEKVETQTQEESQVTMSFEETNQYDQQKISTKRPNTSWFGILNIFIANITIYVTAMNFARDVLRECERVVLGSRDAKSGTFVPKLQPIAKTSMDFDFNDLDTLKPQLRTVKRGQKPKKKTANFADVVKRINIA